MTTALDHLVVAAHTLAQGVAWCEATLGLPPDAGGRHAAMGTHNRLLAIGSDTFPHAYLEIIAVDPDAPRPQRQRWFGLDDAALQRSLRDDGPRLLHWVARTDAIGPRRAALAARGADPGAIVAAERDTPQGTLRWRITVRDDGRLLAGGALPTWIEWQGAAHPAATLPARALALRALTLRGVAADLWRDAAAGGVTLAADTGPALAALIDTPRGPVTLASAAMLAR